MKLPEIVSSHWGYYEDTTAFTSEEIEKIGSVNDIMNERRENFICSTLESVNTIETHVDDWSESNTKASSSLSNITLKTHNAELHANMTAAVESFQNQ